jgi:hypothetical protein
MFSRLVGAALLGPLFLVATPKAEAQVTLNLTTTQQTNCTITTDAQGIRLVPGGTDLIATGVTLSGTGCGTQGGAPTPNPLTITPSPSSGVVGTTFQLAWTVSGATSCAGTASLGGVSTPVAGWTDVNTANSPRTVTLSTVGTYQFNLTCSNATGSTSGSTSVVVSTSGGGGNCPAGRQTTAQVCYAIGAGPINCTTRDMTQYSGLFGHQTPTDTAIDFPGYDGLSIVLKDASKAAGSYFATQFTMPAALDAHEFGKVYKGETYGTHPMTFSISPTCGDFTSVPNASQCSGIQTVPSDSFGVAWKNSINTAIAACPLTPGQSYYLNFKFTTPPTDSTNCNATTCYMPLSNTLGTTPHL